MAVRPGGTYLDATFGAGGHARGILERIAGGKLIALDADPAIEARATALGDARLVAVHTNFSRVAETLDAMGIAALDGALFDLGVSSMQLDEAQRGFSFRDDAPLDMRLDPTHGPSAYDLLRELDEEDLANVIFEYGEERGARRIARAVVARRRTGALPSTTQELARLVAGVLHRRGVRERIHPATRTFQALRIAVNGELDALRAALPAVVDRLRDGGRIVVIAFHSLEDRIVKEYFRSEPRLHVLTRKPLVAGEAELAANPRARSAKLRAAQKGELAA